MAGNLCVLATSPSENASLYKGFCKAPFIGLVDTDTEEIVWMENPFVEDTSAASMFLKFLLDKQVEYVVAADKPGAGVFPILNRAGIVVYTFDGTVKDAIKHFIGGSLKRVEDSYPRGDCK